MSEDELKKCPRCGSPIEWIKLKSVPGEQFATCTRCTWGED